MLLELTRGSKASRHTRSLAGTVRRVAGENSGGGGHGGDSAKHSTGTAVARNDNGGAAGLADAVGDWAGCNARGES